MEQTIGYKETLTAIIELLKNPSQSHIPVGVSNRHIHLSQEDLEIIFGSGYSLTKLKDLSQPGQYSCKETITICGPKGAIENVRVLGPVRSKTQVELLASDCFKLGVNAPIRSSGELCGTPGGVTLVGLAGSLRLESGVIIAKRHIHMTTNDAERLHVRDGQIVSIEVHGARGGVLHDTIIRASDASSLECHLDREEASALGAEASSTVEIRI